VCSDGGRSPVKVHLDPMSSLIREKDPIKTNYPLLGQARYFMSSVTCYNFSQPIAECTICNLWDPK